ncbi:hypothetical protein H6P81_006492 [Aristolochia fimbriata]|uniref:POTRA domain-containing protein n=1 Tax=Aristolochia fimbriata TaxID=158543 RepID=A0AAV7F1Z5_ARIFI|nr:hypothetical protein H6P81_006492 [Aristolochia fimbriata]
MAAAKPEEELTSDSEEEEEEDDYVLEEDEEEFEEEEEESVGAGTERFRDQRSKLNNLFRRLSSEPVLLRVHDIIIKGNTKTVDSVIESEIRDLKTATSMQELLQAASVAAARLHRLDIFETVNVTLDAGPPELPDTANVVIEVVEAKSPITGDVGIFTKPEARSWSVEGSLKFKNLFGHGDIWKFSGAYGWDQTGEISTGLSLPRLKGLWTPVVARIFLLSQDWLKFSSYQERLLGVSVGLLSTQHHDLEYNLTWRTLTDPSHMASKSIRRQLGYNLLSSLKYTYKVDRRDSQLRPTRGYAFVSKSQIGGLGPDSKSLKFLRQEFDFRFAIPLGFYRSALNFGVTAGVALPWGKGFMSMPTPLPEQFFIGSHLSPVCSLGGPSTLFGFKCRGLGPSESRRFLINKAGQDDSAVDPGRDVLGGDLAVTAFADLSFDLPLKLFREAGIHGHMFACAGNLAKLSGGEIQNFSLKKFGETFRSSAGCGIVIPTKLFRIEINYCYILKQLEHDQGKTGIQFNFSSPF